MSSIREGISPFNGQCVVNSKRSQEYECNALTVWCSGVSPKTHSAHLLLAISGKPSSVGDSREWHVFRNGTGIAKFCVHLDAKPIQSQLVLRLPNDTHVVNLDTEVSVDDWMASFNETGSEHPMENNIRAAAATHGWIQLSSTVELSR